MQKSLRLSIVSLAAGTFALFLCSALPCTAYAADNLSRVQGVSCPTVTLDHWRNSSRDEKLAFLLGFVSLLEMEKEWQGKPPLPIRQSIIGSWVRGLDGMTLGDMSNAIDTYAGQHPEQTDLPVLKALGDIYVRPGMSQADRTAAEKRVREIRARDHSRR